jgi:hypothetical protein
MFSPLETQGDQMLIRRYLNASLCPLLKRLGITSSAERLICEDVQQRLESVLGNWADGAFRKSVLILGLEEATYYEPVEAPLELRAMVVVAVRNSMIEDLSATHPYVPALRRFAECMPDTFVPTITRQAILFFRQMPCSEAGWGVLPPRRKDVFRELAQDFPESWKRLHALATADGQEVEMHLNSERKGFEPPISKLKETLAVLSGYMPEFTADDARIFAELSAEPGRLFFAHSFKWFTRNPAKLLRGMEIVVNAGGAFVTSNYYVSGDYCARRVTLMRPAHTVSQMRKQLSDLSGLVGRHRAKVQEIAQQSAEQPNDG